MAVTGAIKFFERSKALLSDGGVRATFTQGPNRDNISINNALSFDRDGYFRGTPSGDQSFRESVSFLFSPTIKINRLFLVDTNLDQPILQFQIRGNRLSNVTDIDNNAPQLLSGRDGLFVKTLGGLRRYRESRTLYYEFDEIEISSLNIAWQMQTTSFWGFQARPYLRQLILTNEIGTFVGFPNISAYSENQNEIVNQTSTGLKHITKQHETIDTFKILFHSHPIENDISIGDKLFASRKSFTLWPCGGGYGSNHFLFEKEGWRLGDIYNVQTTGMKSNRWYKNFYKGGISSRINLVESL